MKVKLKDSEECRLEFIHFNGKPATLSVAMNPLTGNWLSSWKVGDQSQADYDTKAEALKMLNGVIKKSAEKNLPCKVTIQPRTVLADVQRQK